MLPSTMRDSLCEYQSQGIEFVVAKRGRALIADEMGLGKSVQALGAAVCMKGWPLLIVCPATMRLVWAEECERWLPHLALRDKHIIFACADKPPRNTPKIVIVSYKMLQLLRSDLLPRAWGMVIVDESHTLRTPLSRTQVGINSTF
jgi:SNF2 family DNA or RNA helicase